MEEATRVSDRVVPELGADPAERHRRARAHGQAISTLFLFLGYASVAFSVILLLVPHTWDIRFLAGGLLGVWLGLILRFVIRAVDLLEERAELDPGRGQSNSGDSHAG